MNGKSSNQEPKVFILSAPSGGGKTSLARALADSCEQVVISVSHTTRPPRPGEAEGVDYYFVAPKDFEQMIEAGDFLEYARVFEHHYGTSRGALEGFLAAGKSVILEIDWQGAREVRAAIPSAISIYILPPSVDVLAARLMARGRDSTSEVGSRMEKAANEMSHYGEYDHAMVNGDFAAALTELRQVVLAGRPPLSASGLDIEALVHSAKSVRLKNLDAANL